MKYVFWPTLLAVALIGVLSAGTLTGETHRSSAGDATELFAKHCASCHGKDGRAKTFKGKLKHARNLTDPAWQGDVSDERLFNSITNGKGKMPSYGKKLSEQEIESLVAYVRALKN